MSSFSSLSPVCPVVHVTIPSLTTTGGTVNIQTVVATKPRPQNNSVSLKVRRVTTDSDFIPLASETDGMGHRVPTTLNNYSFFHSISIPWNLSVEDQVQVIVDTSGIQRGPYCGASNLLFDENIRVVKGKWSCCYCLFWVCASNSNLDYI